MARAPNHSHPFTSAPLLAGREHELAVLRARLGAALDRHGSLVLVGGTAGIGKTALARAIGDEAAVQDVLVLTGRCYDLAETPPYGPWCDLLAGAPAMPGVPLPAPFAADTPAADMPSQVALFARIRDFLIALASQQPLLLVLEDLHWTDSASLDLLRFLSHAVPAAPLLILGTYRGDELDRTHPLYQFFPALVREADATRVDLRPLTDEDIRTLVHARYTLADADERRLAAYLAVRSEGNPLFVNELARMLEEEGFLRQRSNSDWTLGDLSRARVPLLLRQLIERRLTRLGNESERLLIVAAIIGQETPLALWQAVSGADEEPLLDLVERAAAARVLEEVEGGTAIRFGHALIREALYEGVPLSRRRLWHRAIAEALAASGDPDPHAVAHHFRQAGDARATEWFVRAGWLAYRSFAYETARAHFAEALLRIGGAERVRILLALTALERFSGRGARYAEETLVAAREAGDEVLTAIAQFRLGINLGYQGHIGTSVTALEEASAVLDTLPDDALPALEAPGLRFTRYHRRQHLALAFTRGGQWRQALALLGAETLEDALSLLCDANVNGTVAVMNLCVIFGLPDGVRRSLDAGKVYFTMRADDAAMPLICVCHEHMLYLPFLADDREARKEIDEALAHACRQAERALGDVPPMLNRCPRLVVEGRWKEARTLWAQRHERAATHDAAWSLPSIGAMARARGARDAAWALVREGLPDGLLTEPGTAHFIAMDLQRLAARLALDEDDHAAARTWLETHDRWLAWAGPEVRWGRADGHQAWAEYRRACGESEAAQRHAEQALTHASQPRQPLPLLAAHRLHGELATDGGQFDDAATHLGTALALADACAAPYERALTLLALAKLSAATGQPEEARQLLDAARARCAPLDAKPALARAEAFAARLASENAAPPKFPAGLSPREAEVLRLVASGLTDSQVAEQLFLSPRTVGRHLGSIYTKLGVASRAAATRFAVEHHLT